MTKKQLEEEFHLQQDQISILSEAVSYLHNCVSRLLANLTLLPLGSTPQESGGAIPKYEEPNSYDDFGNPIKLGLK